VVNGKVSANAQIRIADEKEKATINTKTISAEERNKDRYDFDRFTNML